MIRWGILATGTIAHKFAQTLVNMKAETQLTACASRSLEKAEQFAQKYEIPVYYGSYEELAQAPEADVIYVATPNNLHFDNVKMCIEAGKHVLCEKPMTLDAKQSRELFALAKEKQVFLGEAFWIKMLPLYETVRDLIDTHEIGTIKHVRADYGFTVQGERRTRKFLRELGGGALLDIGVYNIGFACMILGYSPESIKSVVKMSEFGTDEFETILLEYPNGATAALTISIGMKLPKEGVIYGTKGLIRFPDFQKAEYLEIQYNDDTSKSIEMPFEINGFEYQIRETVKCIERGEYTGFEQSPENTAAVMEIMDKLREEWDMKWEK